MGAPSAGPHCIAEVSGFPRLWVSTPEKSQGSSLLWGPSVRKDCWNGHKSTGKAPGPGGNKADTPCSLPHLSSISSGLRRASPLLAGPHHGPERPAWVLRSGAEHAMLFTCPLFDARLSPAVRRKLLPSIHPPGPSLPVYRQREEAGAGASRPTWAIASLPPRLKDSAASRSLGWLSCPTVPGHSKLPPAPLPFFPALLCPGAGAFWYQPEAFSPLLAALPTPICVWRGVRTPWGCGLTHLNRRMLQYLGITPEQGLGQPGAKAPWFPGAAVRSRLEPRSVTQRQQ